MQKVAMLLLYVLTAMLCLQFTYIPTINQADDTVVECTAGAYADSWVGAWSEQAKLGTCQLHCVCSVCSGGDTNGHDSDVKLHVFALSHCTCLRDNFVCFWHLFYVCIGHCAHPDVHVHPTATHLNSMLFMGDSDGAVTCCSQDADARCVRGVPWQGALRHRAQDRHCVR